MPYIKRDDRRHYEEAINLICNRLAQREYAVGDINYVVTMILKRAVRSAGHCSYVQFNALMGVLECIKQEFYRRDVVPYERDKICENGDVHA